MAASKRLRDRIYWLEGERKAFVEELRKSVPWPMYAVPYDDGNLRVQVNVEGDVWVSYMGNMAAGIGRTAAEIKRTVRRNTPAVASTGATVALIDSAS